MHNFKFHPIHPFPARMAPSIALDELPEAGKDRLRVLDPMAGSGTTLVAARLRGHTAYGFDTDPLALLLSGTWCANVDPGRVREVAEEVLARAREDYRVLKVGEAYPLEADEDTRAFVRYWFDCINRRQLTALAGRISQVHRKAVRNVLWTAFSRLIIAKSRGASWAMDLAHSRPHRVLTKVPYRPFDNFSRAVDTVLKNMPFDSTEIGKPTATIKRGDARSIALPDHSVDIVITSPPYLNAIDYIRCSKYSLIWMGHQIPDLRHLRSRNIGSETIRASHDLGDLESAALSSMGRISNLPDRSQRILSRYIADMDRVIAEISRVLVPGGRCILVIGDSTMRGVFVRNSAALETIADHHGLSRVALRSRPLPASRRYLPPPKAGKNSGSMGKRMREEIVLTLQAA